MKKCTKCMEDKPLVDFYIHPNTKDGRQSNCKACKMTTSSVQYLNCDKTERNKTRKEQYHNDTSGQKNRQLKSQYGITLEQYNQMFSDQNGCCKICNIHQSELKRKLFIDHCHKTGKVRGLLCVQCNSGLGFFKDELELFESAIQYLKDNK